ncbi:hypothetical protein [Streptomyces sp. NBC_00439]|uniref:hypothetical protein n=1 Tax=Streptomyces sp. NBC_00439 TaxID=2903650 RepID=UPI002255F3A0|nr:hypothetical protein [Streptomyces sp. NBC_00439]MCX5106953.1 hypothetical protein [Streptomyces sp. NBC_00439]
MSPAQNTPPATAYRYCGSAALGYRFPDANTCSQANRSAVFHPATHEGPPCAEVDGVLVFAYLDHQGGAFRVSVHLDSAAQRLVRPDGTVPLRVVVEDTVVFDDSEKA